MRTWYDWTAGFVLLDPATLSLGSTLLFSYMNDDLWLSQLVLDFVTTKGT